MPKTLPAPRLVTDLDEQKYHADKALSKSSLDLFISSPFKYWSVFRSGKAPPRKESAAFVVGSAVHAAILEPHLFKKNYVMSAHEKRVGKAWNADKKAAEENGQILLTEGDSDIVKGCLEACGSHDVASKLLFDKGGVAEISAFAPDPETGLMLRGRMDLLRMTENVFHVVDLKTAADASPWGFAKSVRSYNYHRQDAMYTRLGQLCAPGMRVRFTFVVVEKTWPYSVGVYELEASDRERGWEEIRTALAAFKAADEADRWPQFGDGKLSTIKAFNY